MPDSHESTFEERRSACDQEGATHYVCDCQLDAMARTEMQLHEARAKNRQLVSERDEALRLVGMMRDHGYIEDRYCPRCCKSRPTIGNECIECGSDT